MPTDFLKWVERNPVQCIALAIFGCVLAFSITSCTARVFEAEFKYKTERSRSFYTNEVIHERRESPQADHRP